MTMSIKRNIKTILKLLQRKKVTKADIVLLSPNQRLVRKKVIIIITKRVEEFNCFIIIFGKRQNVVLKFHTLILLIEFI